MISGKLLDCVDYGEEFGAIGPPVSRLPLYQYARSLGLSVPLILFVGLFADSLHLTGLCKSVL